MTKFGTKQVFRINDYENPTKEEERKKKTIFQNPFLLLLSSFLLGSLQPFTLKMTKIKTKENERQKRKKEFRKIAFFFISSFFIGFS